MIAFVSRWSAVGFALALGRVAGAQANSVRDLGIDHVDPGSAAHINNAGQALVRAVSTSYRITGGMIEAVPGFSVSAPTYGAGLAQDGTVLGNSEIAAFQNRGLVWKSEMPTQLSTLEKGSYAVDMNALGTVVGQSFKRVGGTSGIDVSRATYWVGGVITELETLGGTFESSQAVSINDAGTIVGSTQNAGDANSQRGAVWTNGGLALVPSLDATHPASSALKVAGDGTILVNHYGTVAGVGTRASILRNGVYTDLGDMGSGTAGAFSMNSFGAVVGVSSYADATFASFLWTETDGLLDLNKLVVGDGSVYSSFEGFDINDSGQIVGVAQLAHQGDYRALVLTPVPEPGSLVAMTLGVVAAVRRRKPGAA